MDINSLVKKSILARENAYVPYSNFMVGAALMAKNGKIYTGCNLENAAYSPGICAERTAFAKAVSEGEREFCAIAVAGWAKGDTRKVQAFPCGVCRQVMREFCTGDFKIIIANGAGGDFTEHTLEELLPNGFGPESLDDGTQIS